ncbi:ABC transporter permease [Yoonia sp. 2307UL14-13]|uniref:ABC transporter permease n=1 Tax=Yoonia sp. 2307UL14-13 TaxID=3126506 RepID=UPI0030A3837F
MMVLRRVIGISAALLFWELGARAFLDNVLISSPSDMLTHLSQNLSLYSRASAETTMNAAWGFLWGNLAAIFLAALMITLPRSERLLAALALLVFCVPLIATGPILRVLYGPGAGPQITLSALAVYYTTLLALLVGLRAVSESWTDIMRIYGRGALSTLYYVRARASVPYLFVGLQISAPAAFLGAMIGEFTGAERGLGVLTLRAMRGLETDATWTLAVLSASIAMAVYGLLGLMGQRLVGYAPTILLSPPSGKTQRNLWTRAAEVALITGVVLAIWQISMDGFGLNRFFAKRPWDVASFLAVPDNRATLLAALTETLKSTVPGYLAGLILGAGLAAALTLSPGFGRIVLPTSIALRSIPIITTAPLLVLAFGRGLFGTAIVVAVMIFFPTLVACIQGQRQTPGQIVDLFKSYGATPLRILLKARLPAMLPALFASARMAIPAALLAVTTVEWLATGRGIGVLMAMTASTSDYNMLWSCVFALAVAASAAYAAIAALERAVLKVYANEQVT